jgi:poly(3-hydroxybutyrate) depolymerase
MRDALIVLTAITAMYEPAGRQFPGFAFLWPALAAAAASDAASIIARYWAELAVGPAAPPVEEPNWTTPHKIVLELKTVRLRDFSAGHDGPPVLVCAPFALHGAAIADLAPEHSLVATLRKAGLQHLLLADWRSATPDMRSFGIDDYLATLNVLVDHIGTQTTLIGLSQGGWMALIYAARFPQKVRKLVLAGTALDIGAGTSPLSLLADQTPPFVFRELVRLGRGLVRGRKVLKFWGPEMVSSADIAQLLETEEPVGSLGFQQVEALFRRWHAWTIDLPGTFFLEVVDRFYKRNELVKGNFVALGEKVDLRKLETPIFLLAATNDELASPQQLFAVEQFVGTTSQNFFKAAASCRHLSLFIGKRTLDNVWPKIGRWVRETPFVAVTPTQLQTAE